jgi:aldose 1-epimerase
MTRSICLCLTALALFPIEACQTRKAPPVMSTSIFGRLSDGREVHRYTLRNASGMTVQIIDYGAAITSILVPDRNAQFDDVVLGYDSLQGYVNGTAYFGAIVGRYGNRIAGGRFQLDGKEYQLAVNDGDNHLHGGRVGFNKVLWETKSFNDSLPEPALQLQYVSPDGEEGYPGTLTLKVTYTLTAGNELRINYEGTTDKTTILNPTQHSYFNLSGSLYSTILSHLLMIEAEGFTPVDKGLIPTGQIAAVAGTPMDFRTATVIGARINDPYQQLVFGKGYDHNWVLKTPAGTVRKAVDLYESISGRAMEVFTDQPGVQFYSGNFLDGTAAGKNGIFYQHRSGLCLETQAFPDSPNKPQFPSTTLRPGQVYRQITIYRFSTR